MSRVSCRLAVFRWLILGVFGVCPFAQALPLGEPPPPSLGTGDNFESISPDDYAGKVLIVTLWASWCGPCLNEMTMMEKLRRAAPEELAIVSVNIESAAKFRQVKRILRRELSLTLAHDSDGSTQKAWGVTRIPHMFMVDHTGKLAYEKRGYGDGLIDVLIDQANRLLLERRDAVHAGLPMQQ